jgi:hypothetical protein
MSALLSTWYACRFVNWISHNWSPLNPHKQYSICIKGLEKMLNWSFANDVFLLDWTRADFESYSDFIRRPSIVWATSNMEPWYRIVRYVVSRDFWMHAPSPVHLWNLLSLRSSDTWTTKRPRYSSHYSSLKSDKIALGVPLCTVDTIPPFVTAAGLVFERQR